MQVLRLLAFIRVNVRLIRHPVRDELFRFEAFLRVKDGETGFEFPPRERKSKKDAAPKEPPVKLDFTGQTPGGVCPKCGGQVCESATSGTST